MSERVHIVQGDITRLAVDAIVNAANESLLGGLGVDGAIHTAAGPQLRAECQGLGGCETGEAKITRGYDLPAQWVIHTVGPIWDGGGNNEDELLARCYRNSLSLAVEYGVKTIAFPAISTGVYDFPLARATGIALRETLDFLAAGTLPETAYFVCFSDDAYLCYRDTLESLRNDD